MLHGFPDTPYTWDTVAPAVATAGFRVVTPFTRGYAPTEIPAAEAYDIDELVRVGRPAGTSQWGRPTQ